MFSPTSQMPQRVLFSQLLYIALAALWNISGVLLIANGMRAPGPTASLVGAGVIILLGAGLIFSRIRYRWIYFIISGFFLIATLAALYPPFTADPALWPSEFWRYAGVFLNGFGVIVHGCAVMTCFGFLARLRKNT